MRLSPNGRKPSSFLPTVFSDGSRSSTVRARNPSESREGLIPETPLSEVLPWVRTSPATPQKEAGRVREPAVWVPRAKGIVPAPTAAAEPLEDPPGLWAALKGLVVGPAAK